MNGSPLPPFPPFPIFPGKCSRRGNQMGERWIMMRANDIRPLQNQDVPTPLGTYDTIEKFPSALASLAVLPPRWPTGEHFGGASRGDADARPRDVPNGSGDVVGTGPSWDSWCHRGTFALGRLTEPAFCQLRTASQKGIGPTQSTLSLQPGASQNQNKTLCGYRLIKLKVRKMLKGRLTVLSSTL